MALLHATYRYCSIMLLDWRHSVINDHTLRILTVSCAIMTRQHATNYLALHVAYCVTMPFRGII